MDLKCKLIPIGNLYKFKLIDTKTIDIVLEIYYRIKYNRCDSFVDKHESVINNKVARIILNQDISEEQFNKFKELAREKYKGNVWSNLDKFENILKKLKFKTQVIRLSTDEIGSYHYDKNYKKQYVN